MKPKLHSSSFFIHLSNLHRVTFRAVEVVKIFGFDNVLSCVGEALERLNEVVFVNRNLRFDSKNNRIALITDCP
jgi:hypothetical protein